MDEGESGLQESFSAQGCVVLAQFLAMPGAMFFISCLGHRICRAACNGPDLHPTGERVDREVLG